MSALSFFFVILFYLSLFVILGVGMHFTMYFFEQKQDARKAAISFFSTVGILILILNVAF